MGPSDWVLSQQTGEWEERLGQCVTRANRGSLFQQSVGFAGPLPSLVSAMAGHEYWNCRRQCKYHTQWEKSPSPANLSEDASSKLLPPSHGLLHLSNLASSPAAQGSFQSHPSPPPKMCVAPLLLETLWDNSLEKQKEPLTLRLKVIFWQVFLLGSNIFQTFLGTRLWEAVTGSFISNSLTGLQ